MPQWLVVTQQQVADTATYRDVMMRVWYHSTAGVQDSVNSFSTSGDHTPNLSGVSVNISVPGSGGQGASQLIHERTTRINKSYGSSTSVYAAAWLSGIEYWGAGQEIYANHTYTVPARPYVTPNAPGAPSITRVLDQRHTLSWSRNATTAGPYTSQRVQRRERGGSGWGNWATVANVSGSATSYTDNSTVRNREYQYRIQAVNSAGSRSSAASALVFTTPGDPVGVVARKLPSGDIRLEIGAGHRATAVNYQIQHSTNNGSTWAALATIAGGVAVQTYTHVSPNPAQTHRYRVRAVISASGAVGNGLASGYRTSGTVELAAPPLAPTIVHSPTVIDADQPWLLGDVYLEWAHNPIDSSDLTQSQFRIRLAGSPTWTQVTLPLSGLQFLMRIDEALELLPVWPVAGDVVEWQARTRGAHPTYSPWSATATFGTSSMPTAAITAPEDGATVTDSTLTVEWEYFQAEDSPQAAWRATLLDEFENTVEVLSGSGDTSQVTFDTPVMDGQSYIVRVEVASAMGLWSEPVDVHFDVEYLAPGPVHITDVQWDRNSGTVVLALDPGDWDGITTVEPIAVTVHRSNDGGDTWEVVESEIPLGAGIASLVDTVPPTRGELLYRATAISALPSIAIGEPVAITVNETAYAYLGYGPGFSNILTFYGNLKRSTTAARDEVIEHFAGRVGADNRPAGVIISGETRTRDFSVNATLLMADGMATAEDFEEAAFHGGVMCLRTPDGVSGRRVFGKISPVSTTSEYAPIEGVQFIISETERG